MKTIINTTKKDTTLRIRKRDINSNGEIFPHILFDLLEEAVLVPIKKLEQDYDITSTRSSCIYKVDIIGKAIPGDELKTSAQLGKFDSNTAVFNIQITKSNKRNKQATICKASFSYSLKNNSVASKIAS